MRSKVVFIDKDIQILPWDKTNDIRDVILSKNTKSYHECPGGTEKICLEDSCFSFSFFFYAAITMHQICLS